MRKRGVNNHKKETIQTYNKKAASMSKKFDDLGARVEDIERAFSYVKKDNPKVVELGCGNGRDAEEIVKRTDDYLGMDLSEELIKLAKKKVPTGRFEVADIEDFEFEQGVDIVFAFASLLHVEKDTFKETLRRAHDSMSVNGIFYISVMEGEYEAERRIDKDGPRTFYLYDKKLIKELAGDKFEVIYDHSGDFVNRRWLEVILRKKA